MPRPPGVRGPGIGEFDAVAAVSANDVWAVGDGLGTLIAHWNGSQWSLVKSPSPGTAFNNLYGVAAASASDVWAVRSYSNDPQNQDVQTLIEHWNGSSWSIVPGLNPGAQGNAFNAVTAVSASNVWAVGFSYNSTFVQQTLIEHWNGSAWSVVTSPNVVTSPTP